jgi:hypothetical protein
MEFTARLLEVRLEEGSLAGRIERPAGLRIQPGQYLLGWGGAWDEPLAATLFPAGVEDGALSVCPPLPQSWAAGMPLRLRGPLGQGFRLPASARRVAVASLAGGLSRLRMLLQQALQQGAAVSVFAEGLPLRLPAEVEIQPLDELPSAPLWADYLALELPVDVLPSLRTRLGLKPGQSCPCAAEALALTPLPCGGASACGACAVSTKSGWKLGCKDGPVFPLNELLG